MPLRPGIDLMKRTAMKTAPASGHNPMKMKLFTELKSWRR